MTTEEKRSYYLNTLRKAPPGSSRRTWAEAMLKQLDAKQQPAAADQPAPKPGRRHK